MRFLVELPQRRDDLDFYIYSVPVLIGTSAGVTKLLKLNSNVEKSKNKSVNTSNVNAILKLTIFLEKYLVNKIFVN